MFAQIPIVVTTPDRRNLSRVVRRYLGLGGRSSAARELAGELARARLVPVDGVPATVVTMNARVRLRDLATGETDEYTLVYPGEDESLLAGRLSVMTPLGTAILGTREGDVIPWRVPAGVRRLLVEAVPHQPEAAAGRAATTAGPASGRGWWRQTLDLYGRT